MILLGATSPIPPSGSVTLAMMADLAADRILGRADGAGTGVPQALTAAQVAAILSAGAVGFTGLAATGFRDTSAAFDVTLGFTSNTALTAARALTFNVQNTANTIKLAGGTNAFGASISITGGTVTVSSPIIGGTQTFNDGAVAFTGLNYAITTTAMAASDGQLGGSNFMMFKGGVAGTAYKMGIDMEGLVVSQQGFALMRTLGGDRQMFVSYNGADEARVSLGQSSIIGWSEGNDGGVNLGFSAREGAGIMAMRKFVGTGTALLKVYGDGATATKFITIGHDATNPVISSAGGVLNFASLVANVDVAGVSTHSVPIKIAGTTYNFLVKT